MKHQKLHQLRQFTKVVAHIEDARFIKEYKLQDANREAVLDPGHRADAHLPGECAEDPCLPLEAGKVTREIDFKSY